MDFTVTGMCIQLLAYLGLAALIFSTAIGSIAAISPAAFEKIVRISDKRFSLDRFVAIIERPIDVEQYLKPCTRILGIATVTSAICVGIQFYSMA